MIFRNISFTQVKTTRIQPQSKQTFIQFSFNERDTSHLKLITDLSCAETSKELQIKISNETGPLQIHSLFLNLKRAYANLIHGKNSNYLINCLIRKLNTEEKIEILNEIRTEISKMSIHEYGSHPIQCFIENLSSNREISILLSSLSNKYKFVSICNNSNGLIQKKEKYYFHISIIM